MHETIEALSAYVDDELPADERARVDAHLAACVDCASRKMLLERASASLRTLPDPQPTMDETRRIREGVLRQTRRKSPRIRLWTGLRPVWAGAGAFALLIVGVIAGSIVFRDTPRRETTTARSGSAVTGPAALAFDSPRDVRSFVSADPGVKQALQAMGAAPASSQAPGAGEAAQAPQSRNEATGAMPQAPPAPALGYGPKALPSGVPDATSHSVTPPSTLQAPADSGRNDLRAAAPERSASDCLAERQKDRPDLRPAVARPATYSGKPAWLLVYAMPPPSPGSPEQVAVYLAGRADCNVLTYQVFGAP